MEECIKIHNLNLIEPLEILKSNDILLGQVLLILFLIYLLKNKALSISQHNLQLKFDVLKVPLEAPIINEIIKYFLAFTCCIINNK